MAQEEHWRWNADVTWENFSSLAREAAASCEASSPFHRHHHVKASLYFAVGTLESFLNRAMREHMSQKSADETEVMQKLRGTSFRRKLKDWAPIITGVTIETPASLIEAIETFSALRDEATHPKRRDHSFHRELDSTNIDQVQDAVARFIVMVHENRGSSFPYWLLGWNFIGMNGDVLRPALLNNQQFMHALAHMGFEVPTFLAEPMEEWERNFMRSTAGYEKILCDLQSVQDCQPRDPRFPLMPRLCRRWWDDKHVLSCGPTRHLRLPEF